MDQNLTGFNFGALDAMRNVQSLSKYERGYISSGQTVRRRLKVLEQAMASKGLSMSESTTMTGLDPECLLRFILQVHKLDEVARTSSVMIALTGDGAELSSNIGHVTVGFKIIDGRAINPYTNLPLNHLNGGYQSVDLCYPIMTVSERESRELYEVKFGHIYKFFLSLKDGLPESNLGPRLHPFTLAAPHDGKAVLLLTGRGGGAKIAPDFCPYCSCKSSELIEPFVDDCTMCELCKSLGKTECLHWEIETEDKVRRMREEFDILVQKDMIYCTTLAFRDSSTVKYLNTQNRNNDYGPNHILFLYNECNNMQTLRKYYIEIVANVRLRQAHGHLSEIDTTHRSNREEICAWLDVVVPSLSQLIAQEKYMIRLWNAIKRYDDTHDKYLLPPDLLVVDVMHCLNRTVEKIICMVLIRGIKDWVKQRRSQDSFIRAVNQAVNTNEFWNVGADTPLRVRWEVPKPTKKEEYFGPIKLCFKKAKQFFDSVHLLYPICLSDQNIMKDRWKDAIEKFRLIMKSLQRHEDFTDDEIKQLQLDIDEFAALWISLTGEDGIGNYFHYLISGHVTFFLYKYRNLYKLCQQGWESLNGRMKNFHFRRTQMGGKGSKGFIFSPIYRCFIRRIGWALDSIWRPLFDSAEEDEEIYDEIANIIATQEDNEVNMEEDTQEDIQE